MRLAKWLELTGITQAEFGRRIGVTQSRIWQIAKAGEPPRLELAIAIEDATRGKVTVRELLTNKVRP